jgi:hypothetical protein
MAGQAHFGEDWNYLAVAAGVGIRIADADSIAFNVIITVAATVTLTLSAGNTLAQAATLGYTTPTGWAPIVYYYTDSSAGVGTAVWSNKVANNAAGDVYHGAGSNLVPYTGTLASGQAILFTLLASQVPAGYNYVKATVSTGTATIQAISSPNVQRAPWNLPAMSS